MMRNHKNKTKQNKTVAEILFGDENQNDSDNNLQNLAEKNDNNSELNDYQKQRRRMFEDAYGYGKSYEEKEAKSALKKGLNQPNSFFTHLLNLFAGYTSNETMMRTLEQIEEEEKKEQQKYK